ncbi:MAG: DUF4910 domain-containing protein [Halanaerobiales bacterium]|nr:DUF4910 domain-containing protein [Halanaerobiales bacterium]
MKSLAENDQKTIELNELELLYDRLFPICRSITGPGLRETLAILSDYLPLESFSVKTGTKVLNWQVPQEWRINQAWLIGPDGSKIVDFKWNNLHILNYSQPVDRVLDLEELKKHLYTVPVQPEAVPYVTSYYQPRWGFCLAHHSFESLPHGEYHAYIDSQLIDGELNYAHAILPGESKQEILISTYVDHPSMANNELSGPITAAFLYQRLLGWPKRRFTYRFVFVPETIGTIAYLAHFGPELKEKIYSGLVLTCIGGKADLTYKLSRREDTPLDRIIRHLFSTEAISGRIRPFTPTHGSDERHYCSPGFNLPVGQLARLWGYPEYHTSLDNKELITIESLQQSVDEIEKILRLFETDGYYLNKYPYGEIKLDQYNLYPDLNSRDMSDAFINKAVKDRNQLNQLLVVLNYADGENSLLDMAEKYNYKIAELKYIVEILQEQKLLTGPFLKGEKTI